MSSPPVDDLAAGRDAEASAAEAIADQQPLRRPAGILCPDCAAPLFVRRTTLLRSNAVKRHRKCPRCGRQETTYERVQLAPAAG